MWLTPTRCSQVRDPVLFSAQLSQPVFVRGAAPAAGAQHLAFEELRTRLQLMRQPSLLRLQENPSVLSDPWFRAAFLEQCGGRLPCCATCW